MPPAKSYSLGIVKQSRRRKWDRKINALDLEMSALQKELADLSTEHQRLASREALISDICIAFRALAVVWGLCQGLTDWSEVGHGLAQQAQELQNTAAAEREEEIWSCLFPEHPPAGGARELLAGMVQPELLEGPTCKALCKGQPLSLLHVTLACLANDSALRHSLQEKARSLWNPEVLRALVRALTAAVQEQEAAADSASRSEASRRLCEYWVLSAMSSQLVVFLVAPSIASFQGAMLSSSGQTEEVGPVSGALADHLLDQLGLDAQQQEAIVERLQVFSDLQKPLDQQEAAIMHRIAQLLAQGQAVAGVAPSPAMAAAAEQEVFGVPSSLAAGAAAAAAAAAVTGGTAAAAAPPPALSPAGTGSSAALGSAEHQELQSLLLQLEVIHAKLQWLDQCAGFYMAGQLTLLQRSRYSVSAYQRSGKYPGALHLARRISARSSMSWLDSLIGKRSDAGSAGGSSAHGSNSSTTSSTTSSSSLTSSSNSKSS